MVQEKLLLTKIIKGMVKIDKGKVLIKLKKEIGYAPQKVIFLRRNVFENIAFPLRVKGIDKSEIKKKVNLFAEKILIFLKRKNYLQDVCLQVMHNLFHL